MKVELIKNEWVMLPISTGTIKLRGSNDSTVIFQTSDTKPTENTGMEIGSWQDSKPFDGNGKNVWVKWNKGSQATLDVDMGFLG